LRPFRVALEKMAVLLDDRATNLKRVGPSVVGSEDGPERLGAREGEGSSRGLSRLHFQHCRSGSVGISRIRAVFPVRMV
jgi:hypothetical protein